MNSFTVTAASKEVKLDPKGSATVAFTVTNTAKKPVRGTPKLKPIAPTVDKWLRLPGGTRSFSPEESQQLVVEINVAPPGKAGDYSFGLNISNEALPDEDFTEGPAVAFRIESAPPPEPKQPFPWWILIVLAVLLIGGGITVAVLMMPSKSTVPDVSRKPLDQASNLLAQANLKLEVGQMMATGTNDIGLVIDQLPKAASKVPKGTVVRLTVERERDKVSVPGLVNLPFGRIKELFGNVPLTFTESGKRYDSPQAPGTVLEQNPKEGSLVEPGHSVTVIVAAHGVEVPDVSSSRSMKLQDAVNRVIGAQLTIASVNQVTTTATQQWDRVVGQTPPPRTKVAPQTPVVLQVGVRASRPHVIWQQEIRRVAPRIFQVR